VGTDLIAQALAGLVHPAGPAEGPPAFLGDHQATQIGGLAGYCAGVAALIGGMPKRPQRFEISIFEAIIISAELQICHSEVRGGALPRLGVNRFLPTCPLSIHRCKDGWIGITPITPAQWQAFCAMLELPELATDPDLQAPRGRYPHAARMEAAFDTRFPTRTAEEWAALGRKHKVPMVIVPNAQGILGHPVFNARGSLASLRLGETTYRVPLTPLRLEATPPLAQLGAARQTAAPATPLPAVADDTAPLAGVRVVDFAMGWAGPLATRMLADLGAEVIKIEAGRYPGWWRSVDWSPEAIAHKQYEESRHFSALNRGKKSVSLDLTNETCRTLAKALVEHADVVVENQAAGVMPRLGLGYEHLSQGRDDLIMLSMSAFGSGNIWSETRAYGSVLEQGSGLPSFAGRPEWPPTMAHIAYGDPIGGIYGGAALLTALYHQRQTGRGQWINNTQIEAMLPLTTPALLIKQATGREPARRGNRHPVMVPHGCFPCVGEDNWLALAVVGIEAWESLAGVMGRDDWRHDASLCTPEGRRAREDEIEAGISAWTRTQSSGTAAAVLQQAGIAAAPVHRTDEVTTDPHLQARRFFYGIERAHVGQQWQTGLPLLRNGERYPMRGLAPFLGGDSEAVLTAITGCSTAEFRQFLTDGVVSLVPTQLRQSR
jgi:crotonobetainyl-CoA:carnitine CoA-transferase CaiB-like acyl-CoA transferase